MLAFHITAGNLLRPTRPLIEVYESQTFQTSTPSSGSQQHCIVIQNSFPRLSSPTQQGPELVMLRRVRPPLESTEQQHFSIASCQGTSPCMGALWRRPRTQL